MKTRESIRIVMILLCAAFMTLCSMDMACSRGKHDKTSSRHSSLVALDEYEVVSGEVTGESTPGGTAAPAPSDTSEEELKGTVQDETPAPTSPGGSAPQPPGTGAPDAGSPQLPGGPAPQPADTNAAPQPGDEGGKKPGSEEVTPRITAVVIEGNSAVPTDEIMRVISTKIGDPVVESKIQRDIQAIFDMGYFTDVRVDTRFFVGGVKLIFNLLENPVVKEVVFAGNKIAPTSKLTGMMETKVGKVLNTKELYGDMGTINQYYDEELGYLLKPTHIKDLQWTEEGKLVITLAEGMIIKEIDLSGNTVFPGDQLVKFISLKPGDLFNQKTLKKDTDKIAKLYEKKDYILDTIRPNIDPAKGLVAVRVVEATVEEIKIEGNKRTKDYVVLRNMNTKVGQVLRKKRIQRDIERLNNIGYFSSVNIDPEAGSELGKVVLVLKVKEQKTGLATIGLGYTGGGSGAIRSGVTGALSLSEKNFGGRGYGGAIQWQRGVNIDSISASVFDPAINSHRDSIGLSIYRHNITEIQQPVQGSNPVQYALYDDKRAGGNLTYGHPLSDDLSLFLTLKTERIELTQSTNSSFIPVGLFVGTSNSTILSGLYDTRDDMFNPLSGSYGNVSYQVAGGLLGGDNQFNKAQLEMRQYFPVGKNKCVALRAWGGILDGNAPTTDFFYVGGADTIRGYQENNFYGTRMVVMNAEFRFPIAKIKILNGAIFADAGNAWFPGQPSKLWTDAGVGIRLVFPTLGLGVIRIDYAFGQEGSRSTIGIGQTF
ncbi:MAG: POTRA domain-containing protein [Candidatus Eremiobacteraeota bacterium]|nr:POTRA domain-containing protein [Candidatus Eremiobacteraeota bacterium]